MKIDRKKFVKGLVILTALCIVVGCLTQVRKHNSLSLSDYAKEHPEANLPVITTESSDSSETDSNNSSAYQDIPDAHDSEAATDPSVASTMENLQNETENTLTSTLR